jgi:uncharacterized protein (UPF0335 family)
MTEAAETIEPMTAEQLFEKFVVIFNEIETLDLDVKELTEQAKEDGIEDITLIKSVARAKAQGKVSAEEEKLKKKLEKIEELVK